VLPDRDLVDDDDEPTGHRAGTWAVQGVPVDAQRMGLDRHTVEGSMLAMAGTLDGARWTHRAVAWLLLVVVVSPLVLTVIGGLGWW
jgi:hypothetical protein